MTKHLLTCLMGLMTLSIFLSCQKEQSIELGSLAKGALQNDAGECLPKTVGGTYAAGKRLTDSNFLELTISVTAPGRYDIATDTVNGYAFKGSGVFTQAGTTVVRLSGGGTPVLAGIDLFQVKFDSTTCSVSVSVNGGTGGGGGNPTTGEYFPLSQTSWWSYNDGFGDTLKVTVSGTTSFSGTTYQRFIRTDNTGPLDTAYYRKNSSTGFYYESVDTAEFGGATFTQPRLEVLFLKTGVKTNDTWTSAEYDAKVNNVPVKVRVKFLVLNDNRSVAVSGINFTNVLHVRRTFEAGVAGVYQSLYSDEVLYAKGIGRIAYGDQYDDYEIRNWKVN